MSNKIAIAGFQHETNRFCPIPTTFEDFVREDGWPGLTIGSDLTEIFPKLNIPLGGFLKFAAQRFEVVPILWANAEPGGLIQDYAFDAISSMILDAIEASWPLDGIYLDLHGAMVTDSFEDGEGELLKRLRDRFGWEVALAVSLDLHANVTCEMIQATDITTIYRTYPHLDMAQTGFRTGALLAQILESGIKPSKNFTKLPLLIPLQSQCTDTEPTSTIYRLTQDADSLHFAHADIAMGFPPSDIAQSGPAIVTHSFSQPQANRKANQIEQAFLRCEDDFPVPLYSANKGIELALETRREQKPVLIADIQDNSGAGATSDSTGVLATLVEYKAKNCVLAAVFDKRAVDRAHSVGLGGEFSCSLGGQYTDSGILPYFGDFKVVALSDGIFPYHGEMMEGGKANIGPTAAIEVTGVEANICVVVTSERIQCLDRALITHLGIELEKLSIIVVKSTVHFRADFEPVVGEIILIESPGFNPCRMELELFPRLRDAVRLIPTAP